MKDKVFLKLTLIFFLLSFKNSFSQGWENLNLPSADRTITAISYFGNDTIFLVRDDTLFQWNSKDKWRKMITFALDSTEDIKRILRVKYGKMYFQSSDGNVYYSQTYGTTYQKEDKLNGTYFLYQNNKGAIIACGLNGPFYRSLDGIYWQPISRFSTDTSGFASITSTNSGDFYITFVGKVYKSTDDGESWEFVTANDRILNNLLVNSKNQIFAQSKTLQSGVPESRLPTSIVRSVDSGKTWQTMLEFVGKSRPKEIQGKCITNSDVIVFTFYTTSPYILSSKNDGLTWEKTTEGLVDTILDDATLPYNSSWTKACAANSKDEVIIGNESGSIFKRSFKPIKSVQATNNELTEVSISPNPASTELSVKFSGSVSNIRLSSVLGVELLVKSIEQNGVINYDISSLGSGLYFVTWKEKGISRSKKFVVQR